MKLIFPNINFFLLLAIILVSKNSNSMAENMEYTAPDFIKPYFKVLKDNIDIQDIVLPDISEYTMDNMKQKMYKLKEGKVRLASQMEYWHEIGEFTKDGGIEAERKRLRSIWPKVIAIEKGHYTLSQVYEIINNHDYLERRDDGVMVLKVPMLVDYKASLRITKDDTKELLISQDMHSYIVSAGQLFITDTKISGWNIKTNDYSKYKNESKYRPYIAVWSGGELYIGNSEIAYLGYKKSKSYGISYTPVKRMLNKYPERKAPTGWIIDSKFSDLYFGFYCYDASDIAIINNVYADNIVYGIDPHDRSERLIIAHNEAYGSKEKHGIIISREVNNSWIFNNYSHNNKGSGIMLDRSSSHNVVAYNISVDNEGDGLAIFESPHNILYKNKFNGNAKSGIRVRNSWGITSYGDTIVGNGQFAINGYTYNLEEEHEHRDFELDPYVKRVNMNIIDTDMQTNSTGTLHFKGSEYINLQNIKITYPLETIFNGEYQAIQSKLLPIINDNSSQIHLSRIKK